MLGPFSINSTTIINRDHNKKIVRILHTLLEMPQSFPFRKPVPHKALKLDDYRNIIKKPIDLNLIRRNNNEGKYKIVQQILDDIQLCWDNCKLYNAPDSQIYNQADYLEKQFIKLVMDNFPNLIKQDIVIKLENSIEKSNIKMIDQKNQQNNIEIKLNSIQDNYSKQQSDKKNKKKIKYNQQQSINGQKQQQSQQIQSQHQQIDNSEHQQPSVPTPNPIMVNLKQTPTKQQLKYITKIMCQADKNTLEQILQLLYTYQKEHLQMQNSRAMIFPMSKIHLSTYMRICKFLKLEEGNLLIE